MFGTRHESEDIESEQDSIQPSGQERRKVRQTHLILSLANQLESFSKRIRVDLGAGTEVEGLESASAIMMEIDQATEVDTGERADTGVRDADTEEQDADGSESQNSESEDEGTERYRQLCGKLNKKLVSH